MSRYRMIMLAGVVALFVAAGAVLALRGNGGGGQDVAFDVKVSGTTMRPSTLFAHHNDSITLTVTTDRDEEIHLHGYDIPFQCKAGKPLSKTFKADKTGRFDIEIEETSAAVGELDVS